MLETCCDILVEAYHRNWITSRDGNISIRYHDRNHFYITPSGVRKQKMQYDMFKKIRIVEEGGKLFPEVVIQDDISGNLQPSGELPLHFGLQKQLGQHIDDIRVVVHVHPTYTIAAMHAGIILKDLVKDFPELSRYTKVAPNVGDVPPISQELGDACHAALGLRDGGYIAYDIVGIKGHGVVAVDSTPWRAFEHIERLEHICKIVLASGVHNKVKQWIEK
jgi:L-fuculose-phosphate aldolase